MPAISASIDVFQMILGVSIFINPQGYWYFFNL